MPKQLTYKERCQIEGYLQVGNSKSAIAKQLKRAVSTIHDEIKRNQCADGIYRADEAAALSLARKQAQRTLPRKIPPNLWLRIESLLGDEWSPEQISGWLQLNEGIKVSHEWIYQHIWKDKTQGGSLYEHLRNQGKRYQNAAQMEKPNAAVFAIGLALSKGPLSLMSVHVLEIGKLTQSSASHTRVLL